MAWTSQQEKAIHTRGSNIIVSAGAGSGKTAVLSERILEYCLAGNDIRKILVLTFTNAAASEMKERIRDKLIENNLLTQAELIDVADITTFDAYSLSLVKKYYYRLGLEKNINIIDSSLLQIKTEQILDEIFIEKYEDNDECFLELLRKYTTQDDNQIKKYIIDLLKKIELLVDIDGFYNNFEGNYYSDEKLKEFALDYEKLVFSKVEILKEILSQTIELTSIDLPSGKLYDEATDLKDKLDNVDNYYDLSKVLRNLKFSNVSSKASFEVKENKKLFSKIYKDIVENYLKDYYCVEDMITEVVLVKNDIIYILKLVKELQERIFAYKKSIMCFDYIDIAKMAISLVRDFPSVHDEIAENLVEILIDEYQDTSDIQETFISYISKNNCYMVGDNKQSIYRFRNANPYIFKEKYEKYSNSLDGIKIDLTFNFRSRKEVLDNINLIFNYLMTNECGDANYSQSHQMIYGQKNYETCIQEYDFNMEILNYDEVSLFSDELVEAFICANKVKEIMNSKVKVLKKDGYKEVSYNDFAILIDKSKFFPLYKRVFEYLGIPLSIQADMDLSTSILPKLFGNILMILDSINKSKVDTNYKHALASVFRSFLVGFDDEEIYFLLNGKESIILNELKVLAEKVLTISYEDLFDEICGIFDIYNKLPVIGDVENSLAILEYIFSLFKTISNTGMSLESAALFFNNVFKLENLKCKVNKGASESVKVMTIHQSKGLEFPFCLFPMLATNFNTEDLKKPIDFSKKYGVYMPLSTDGKKNTILKSLVNEEVLKADISEKVRLFYVALTRAREKMIIISKEKDYNENSEFKSFNSMLKSLPILNEYITKVDTTVLGITNKLKVSNSNDIKQGDKIVYKNNSYLGEKLVKKHISKEIKELKTPVMSEAIKLGIEFHECLEVLNLKNPNVESLNTSDFIKNTIKKVLEIDIFSNIKNAHAFHEHEFYFENGDDSYHGIIDLLLVYEDHIDIVDYKLSNTDSIEYIRQLKVYREYVKSFTDKPINCYLLSILKQEVEKIDIITK